MKTISATIVGITQLIYLILIPLSLFAYVLAMFGKDLESIRDYRYPDMPTPNAIAIRGWGLVITSLAFPFVAIISGIAACHFRSKEVYKKAIFITFIPLLVVICHFLLLSW